VNGKKSDDHQGAEDAEVQDEEGEPLPDLRPGPGLPPEIRDVPSLFS
jgi:hypothetical protein